MPNTQNNTQPLTYSDPNTMGVRCTLSKVAMYLGHYYNKEYLWTAPIDNDARTAESILETVMCGTHEGDYYTACARAFIKVLDIMQHSIQEIKKMSEERLHKLAMTISTRLKMFFESIYNDKQINAETEANNIMRALSAIAGC